MPSISENTTVSLRRGAVSVDIDPVGARLTRCVVEGISVVPQVSPTDGVNRYVGTVIAPWPNRIEDGRYVFSGLDYQLECNESDRSNALHGFTGDKRWEVEAQEVDSVTLTTHAGPAPGYPWTVLLRVTYRLEAQGVSISLTATNLSSDPAPFGAAFHPYLVIPGSDPASWEVTMAADTVVVPDTKRLLPTQEVGVDEAGLDFREGATASRDFLDHAFGSFSGPATVRMSDPLGASIELKASVNSPWMQLHRPVEGPLVGSLVIEPQTCPPNAFRSGQDLIIIQPGDVAVIGWELSVLSGGGDE